jgi:hypothetical protein
MKFPKLALPEFDARIKSEQEDTFIFDIIRKKYIVLTPEEWVRQHFIHLLIHRLGYPQGLFQVERGHQYFGSAKRSDILILNTTGEAQLLVECKAPNVPLNQSTLTQIAAYNKSLKANYVAISNGLSHFVWEYKGDEYVQLKDFPPYMG